MHGNNPSVKGSNLLLGWRGRVDRALCRLGLPGHRGGAGLGLAVVHAEVGLSPAKLSGDLLPRLFDGCVTFGHDYVTKIAALHKQRAGLHKKRK